MFKAGAASRQNGAEIHWQFHRVRSFRAFRYDLRGFFEQHGVPAELCEELTLVTQEACNNACRCGGDGADFDVSVCRIGGTVVIEVADRGCGFDLETVQATWPPELLRGDGRGLFLMTQLSDQIEVVPRRRGTLVRMFEAVA